MSRIKPYIGKNQRTESDGSIRYYEDYNYYNEREWRYVPDKLDFKKQCIKIGKNGELCETLHENTNNDDCRLKFSCDDIKYLFVESEEERLQLIKFLDSKFEDKITAMQLILLKSRILTKEQLEHDI